MGCDKWRLINNILVLLSAIKFVLLNVGKSLPVGLLHSAAKLSVHPGSTLLLKGLRGAGWIDCK